MPAVRVADLTKSFGSTEALTGVDLEVADGEVLGLLGPNGAGKTTLVRVLATLLVPDGGSATIFGRDVVRDAAKVRRTIGLTGQYAAVDELLSGRENLQMFGELFHLRAREARHRADELLERFDLVDAADRPARTYSGGMRRRLDLASSLLVRPRLLFLDEPTTGLDPRSRNAIWDVIREIVAEGTTLLLTTQYLEEADQLADRIAVIDHGHIIAEGTGDQLKDDVGGQVVDIMLSDAADMPTALAAIPGAEQVGDARSLRVAVEAGRSLQAVGEVAGQLHDAGLEVRDLGLRRPTLDDVFLTLTDTAPPDSTEAADDSSEVAPDDTEAAPDAIEVAASRTGAGDNGIGIGEHSDGASGRRPDDDGYGDDVEASA